MALCDPSAQPHFRETQQVNDWTATTMDLGFFCRHSFVGLPHPNNELSGQTIVVTGSNIGLGLETARYFTRCNAAEVILAVKRIKKLNGVVEVWQPGLGSYESCHAIRHRRRKVWLRWTLSWRMLGLPNSISRSRRAVWLPLRRTSLVPTLFEVMGVSVLLLFVVRVKENPIA